MSLGFSNVKPKIHSPCKNELSLGISCVRTVVCCVPFPWLRSPVYALSV